MKLNQIKNDFELNSLILWRPLNMAFLSLANTKCVLLLLERDINHNSIEENHKCSISQFIIKFLKWLLIIRCFGLCIYIYCAVSKVEDYIRACN